MPKRALALAAAVLAVITGTGISACGSSKAVAGVGSSKASVPPAPGLPPQVASQLKVPELWYTPQIVKPGARPVATDGTPEEPNMCSFPIRFWAYRDATHTMLPNGDLKLHLIKVITYQALSGRTIFETDNFQVLISRTHPHSGWKVSGRFGEWFLDGKLVWLESGPLTATPTPQGENIVNPHPGPMTTRPDLCKLLSS